MRQMDLMSASALWASPLAHLDLVGLAGILVWHLIPRRRSNTRLVVQIGFFAAMTAILLRSGASPFIVEGHRTAEDGTLLVVSARLLWWVHLAWAVIGFVRITLVLDRHPREARLLQDLVVGTVYLGVGLSILAFVFGIPVGTLVATSGVIAIILGLALQNTLGDVFSGIAMTLGRPFAIGDWIVLSDGTEGRVVESTWRSTHLLTGSNNVVVLPNSVLAGLGLTNVSRPDESHSVSLVMRLAPTRMPAVIADVMQSALLSSETVMKEPPPVVALKGLDAAALEIELSFRVASPAQRTQARNEVLDLVYRHCKAAGLLLALPPGVGIAPRDLPAEETARPPQVSPAELVEAMPIFAALTREERRALAGTAVPRDYRKGDVIVREGDSLSSLMIIRAGVVVMRRDGREAGRLAPGDFFGETGLLAGMGEACTLEAFTRVTVYEIDQAAFGPLIENRPALAEDLALSLSARAGKAQAHAGEGPAHGRSPHFFLGAIHTVFRKRPAG
ncbi:cyclic nucleotide-binding domain-containing protein [Inquilinus sp. Marseille-Q2685]|uniref:cyclic nucleotide-binding domain-containing protein n=1 Tax=Inquilinus sp. Marseille-Q2685 TaxID=2866581 RepID=UPI001CE434ED|nr:mechanosensitive ion channel family protein [Inquilinus sp. Marseille-Q2685]